MILSLIELAPEAEREPEFWREVGSPQGAHQALWRLFSRSPDQRRDFLFRQEVSGQGRPRFFALSAQAPAHEGSGLWQVDSKPFAPKLRPGDRLGFTLRASPTVSRPKEKGGASQRHDLVMDAKRKAGDGAFNAIKAMTEEGARWLQQQGKRAGFELDSGEVTGVGDDGLIEETTRPTLRVEGYRQHRLLRKGTAPIRFSTLDFEGVLVVRDPAAFLERVKTGFGPQKAFGCGLMLLRRA